MGNYIIPENPVYEEEIKKLENIDPANADTVFNPLLSKIINNVSAVKKGVDQIATSLLTFDLIIKTQVEFEEMYNSPSWLNAVSVAFVGDGGTLKFTRSDGKGLQIPQTVKQIQGFNSAIIEVTSFVYSSTTNEAGLWYKTLPTTDDYSISDLTVNCTGADKYGYAFYNCTQLTNCNASSQGNGYGFYNCTQLTNCNASATTTDYGYGFYKCTQLANCNGTGIAACGSGFYSCTQLTDCNGYGTGTTTRNDYGVGFSNCTQLTNCNGTGTGNGGFGFSGCTQLTNCTGTGIGIGDNAPGTGFHLCTQLTNCNGSGNGSGTGQGHGFKNCKYLNSCTSKSIAADNKNGSAYGFDRCTLLTNCDATGNGYGYGFNSCTQLANCNGTGFGNTSSCFYFCKCLNSCSATDNAIGFSNCTQLTNCIATATTTSTSTDYQHGSGFLFCTQLTNCTGTGIGTVTGIGYGFYGCKYLNGCKPGDTPSTTGFLGGTNTMVDTLTVG